MNWVKYIIITLLFFLFAVLQTSFLPYFNIAGSTPSLIFILFFILIFFETPLSSEGFFMAIIAGFFADIFLPSFFGLSIIAFLIIYLANKLAGHFLREGQEKYQIFYFIPVFLAGFAVYEFLLNNFNFGEGVLLSLAYSLFFACIGFYICKKLIGKSAADNQLRLFK